jgi:flagellar hook-length control protein FliK
LAHIHLISNSGSTAQSGTRATPGQNLSADEGDKAVNSFEALLAAGADALSAEQAALQQTGENESGDRLDPTADKATEAADFSQLPAAGDDALTLAEQADDPAQLVTEKAQNLADGDAPVKPTAATVPLAVDAGKEIKAGDKPDPNAPELRLSAQQAGSDRPATTAKAGLEPAASTQQPLQMTTNPEAPPQQPGTPVTNVGPSLQPTPAQLGNAAPSTTGVSIEVPEAFGSSGWTNAFSQRVVLAVGRNDQLAEIRVNPPHLGPVEVTLSLSGDDKRIATVHFAANHASVREAIESAIPRLREMFNEAGISLGNATVGSESSGRETGDSSRGNAATEQASSGGADDQATPSPSTVSATIAGKVDTFA